MGAWGRNTFENDGALDWLGDFQDSPSESMIIQTFSPPSQTALTGFFAKSFGRGSAPLEPELDGEAVLAAAELVSYLKGHPPTPIPEEFMDLPHLQISNDTVTLAIDAIDSVLRSSNLKDCWEETDDYSSWKDTVLDLRQRLQFHETR